MEYYSNYKFNEKGEVVLTTREFPVPKNVIKGSEDLFSGALRYSLEKRYMVKLDNMYDKAVKDSDTAKEKELEGVIAALKANMAKEPKLSTEDANFIKYLTICIVGASNTEWDGSSKVVDALTPCVNAVKTGGKPTNEQIKALKTVLNDFCYKRLGTTNISGIFKNFHCEFNTESTMHIVMRAEGEIKATKAGFVSRDLSDKATLHKLCIEILKTAAKQELKFETVVVEKL